MDFCACHMPVVRDMVSNMKTTVDIPDDLMRKAKAVAARQKITLRALIEEGLRKVLREQEGEREAFKLRRATFRGEGLLPHADEDTWERIRSLIYEERGG